MGGCHSGEPRAARALGQGEAPRVRIFRSFEEENAAEHRRLAEMSPEERLEEFSVLQARRWGPSWASMPMVKTATWERVNW